MQKTSYRALLLSVAALCVTGCDSLFAVEVKAEEICKTERDVDFPAAFPGTATIDQEFSVPLGDFADTLPDDSDVETELRLKRATAEADTDLSGVERATLSVRRPGSGDPVVIGEYRRTGTGTTQTLRLTNSAAVDILNLAKQEEVEFLFEASGSLPTRSWSADLEVCVGVRAKASYFDLLF